MLPIVLDLARFDTIVIGDGVAAAERLRLLDEAGASHPRIFTPPNLPSEPELATARLVFIVDRHAPYAAAIATRARAAGALVHIEDDPAQSDLHMPAVLRRGELLLAISTGGASPALATRLKRALGELFGPEWRGRVEEVAKLRQDWRAGGADPELLKQRTEELVERRQWLPRLSSRVPTDSH